ncbi:MAG: hypothetical protein K6V97_03800 [Actinomycetia bacterium]|nr:hypothetical protein [Actinomycetes bacterium]
MAQLYATPALLAAGPTNTSFLAAVQDANNHIAVAMTKFTQTPSGILVPEQTDANGYVIERSTRLATTVYSQANLTLTANGTSGSLAVGTFTELALDIDVTAVSGTSPTLNFVLNRIGPNGNAYQIWAGAQITATGSQSASIGAGLTTNVSFGATVELVWTVGGTSPSFTVTLSIVGK